MRIKTNKTQLDAVALLLALTLDMNKPTNIAEKLVYKIVEKAFNKIRIKAEALFAPRSGYGFSLTDEEAMAMHIFLEHAEIATQLYPYEVIQLKTISDDIHRNYG